jgi:hypothetical protein
LATQGYKHVREYVGGKQDWLGAGLPAEGTNPRDPTPPAKKA